MTKRALITGITGMVGSHLADFLLENTDWDIYGMCRWRSPLDNVEHLLDRANKGDRLFFVSGNLLDSFSLAKAINEAKPDYVFHLAAQSYPRVSFDAPIETLDTNILGTCRLLEVIESNLDIDPIIHICSSSEVYGRVSVDKLPINESCSFHGASPYAISKIGTDHVAKYYQEAYGMKILITRMFTHSVSRWTPVILRDTKSGLIDIKYISEIRSAQKVGGYLSGKRLDDGTQIWGMSRSDLEVWNENKWTKIKHLSCHPINDVKMLCVTTRCGVIHSTSNHSIIGGDRKPVEAKKLKKGDVVLTTSLPVVDITEVPEDLAWLYGFFVAEGCMPLNHLKKRLKTIKIANTKIELIERSKKILLKYLGADSTITSDKKGMFNLQVKKPEKFMKYFDDCYASDRNKRIPKIILNANNKTKLAFLRGFNVGDGCTGGKRNDVSAREYIASEFYSFKTKSPLVASGLCFLIESVLKVNYRIHTEYRDNKMYYEIRCHKQTESKRGNQFIKPGNEIIDVREIFYEGEVWDFETENHWFNAGIGNIIVHNTGARRGDIFVESTFAKQIAMIEQGLIDPIIKVGNLDSLRTWADVRDAVRAYFLLVTSDPQFGECYNIGGAYSCTVGEMLRFLINESDLEVRDKISIEVDIERLRPLDADLQVPDTSKFTNHTGWKPIYSFASTMKSLLDYWRDRIKTKGAYLTR